MLPSREIDIGEQRLITKCDPFNKVGTLYLLMSYRVEISLLWPKLQPKRSEGGNIRKASVGGGMS